VTKTKKILTLMTALLGVCLFTSTAQAQGQADGFKVGLIDMEEVFQLCSYRW